MTLAECSSIDTTKSTAVYDQMILVTSIIFAGDSLIPLSDGVSCYYQTVSMPQFDTLFKFLSDIVFWSVIDILIYHA